jgi:signal transduction histidine kinase
MTWISDTTRRQDVLRGAVVAAGIVSASLLHFFTPPHFILWHNVFQRLYYLPIVYAAVYFGWRGGLLGSSASAILYIPHIMMAWHYMPDYATNQYAEIILFFLVGTTTGILADRERKRRQELQATTEQLGKVYRELQDSFEQLRRADRLSAIGELSASLAHEIRNPLGSIEGAAQILEQPQTTEEMRSEFLGVIRKECRRLSRLLTNLLDFSRPRQPEFQEVDVRPVVDSVVALLAHTAQQSGVELRKHLPASLPLVESDSEQLKQVILNLAINAIQAMPDGGKIEISAAEKNAGIVIAIEDQGTGIPAENLEKIFDPFFTTKDGGTGLGLSVAHQIITQHGGVITAERNVDRGMTLSVMIPIRRRRES